MLRLLRYILHILQIHSTLNLRLPRKYLKYQRVWYSGFSSIGVLGEPNICWRKNRSNCYKQHSRQRGKKMGIKWKTKWDESKQLRSPRNKTGLERWKKEIQKNLIVWSLYRQLFLTSSFSPGESPFSTRNLLPLSAPSCSICGSWKCIFERRD